MNALLLVVLLAACYLGTGALVAAYRQHQDDRATGATDVDGDDGVDGAAEGIHAGRVLMTAMLTWPCVVLDRLGSGKSFDVDEYNRRAAEQRGRLCAEKAVEAARPSIAAGVPARDALIEALTIARTEGDPFAAVTSADFYAGFDDEADFQVLAALPRFGLPTAPSHSTTPAASPAIAPAAVRPDAA